VKLSYETTIQQHLESIEIEKEKVGNVEKELKPMAAQQHQMLTLNDKIEDQTKQMVNFKRQMVDAQMEQQNQKDIVLEKKRLLEVLAEEKVELQE